MAEEESIFAKKPTAGSAEKSIFDKPSQKPDAAKKSKASIIICAIAALAVIGGIVALILVLVLNQPDYEKMAEATKNIEKASSDSDLSDTNFAYLTNGRFTKTSHDRYVKNAKEDLSEFRDNLNTIKEAMEALEKAGAAKSDVSEEYDSLKSKADTLLPKLESAASDMEKYIEFSDLYYNSKLVVLDSYSSDYSSLKDLTDSEVDKIFQPLMEASSDKLREFASGMAEYIKVVAKFYSKYADYVDGTKTPTEDIKTAVEKDSKEIEKMTSEISDLSDISEDDIFQFTQRDLTDFDESVKKLSTAIKKLL